MKKIIFFVLVSIQFVVIYLLISKIDHNNLLSRDVGVAPIKKESISANIESQYEHFYEPKPNKTEIVNEWGPYLGKYTINKDTLIERYDYEVKKSSKTFRIITLGDSYTYGLYVDTPNNWTEKLEDLLNSKLKCSNLNKFEVINLGVQGYDIQWEVERFLLRGMKYNPDLVLWLLKEDDSRQVNEIMFEKTAKYLPGKGYENWARGMIETYNELGEKKIYDIQREAFTDFFEVYIGRTVLMTFPDRNKYPYDIIDNVIEKYKVRSDFIYLKDIYANKENFYNEDLHPTVSGHEVIAKDIFGYITETSLIPCN